MSFSYIQFFLLFLIGFLFVDNHSQYDTTQTYFKNEEKTKKTIYVVGHDWHTGIILEVVDIPDSLKSKHPKFPRAKYIEIGWGDKDFYQDPDPGDFLAVKAALWPTESVLHINGFDQPVQQYYHISTIIQFEIDKKDFENMYMFIYSAFARDSLGREIWTGKGYYKNSQFFLGEDKYYFPKTCNVWTAQVLYHAGFDISPFRFQTADNLVQYLSYLGKVVSN